jgi:PAS domain S-box-containing protein
MTLRETRSDRDESEQADDAGRSGERDLITIINTIPVPAWSARPDGCWDFLNQRWLEFTGLSLEEARGWGWETAIHPDDMKSLVDHWQACLASGQRLDIEARMRRFDGEYRWFLFRANPMLADNGTIVAWYGTNTDIEDLKQSARDLRSSEQRYRHLFHHMPIAMLRLDGRELTEMFDRLRGEGVTDLSAHLKQHSGLLRRAMEMLVIEEANEQALKLLGAKSREQLLGPGAYFWRGNPDTFRHTVDSRFGGSPTFHAETKLVALDGRIIDVLFTVAKLRPTDESMMICGIVDITERVRAQEMIQQLRAEFSHAARISMLGELAASIAHEVNQPLAAIRTNIETGLRYLNQSDPNVAKARESMLRGVDDARRAADIVSSIRAMAAGKGPQRTMVSLQDIIEESLIFLQNELQSAAVSVSLDLAPSRPMLPGDRVQLQQVIVNLAINAAAGDGAFGIGAAEASYSNGTVRPRDIMQL